MEGVAPATLANAGLETSSEAQGNWDATLAPPASFSAGDATQDSAVHPIYSGGTPQSPTEKIAESEVEGPKFVFNTGQEALTASETSPAGCRDGVGLPDRIEELTAPDSPISLAEDVTRFVETPAAPHEVSEFDGVSLVGATQAEPAMETTGAEVEGQAGPAERIPVRTIAMSPTGTAPPEITFDLDQRPSKSLAASETTPAGDDNGFALGKFGHFAAPDSPISNTEDLQSTVETPACAPHEVSEPNNSLVTVVVPTQTAVPLIGGTPESPVVGTADVEGQSEPTQGIAAAPVVSPTGSETHDIDTGPHPVSSPTASDSTPTEDDDGFGPSMLDRLDRFAAPDSPVSPAQEVQSAVETPESARPDTPGLDGNQRWDILSPDANLTGPSNPEDNPISARDRVPETAPGGHHRSGVAKPTQRPRRKRNQPNKYQAPARTPDALTAPREPRAPTPPTQPGERALSVAVHVHFLGRRNRCQVALLPERADGLEETVTVSGPQGSESWAALQDEWYADLMPDGLGRILREGAQWEAARETGVRWTLTGRDIYVLAGRPERGIFGFVTTTRLLLREDHVVLCTGEMESNVRRALADAGCPAPSSLDEHAGVPAGWVLFKDVRPTTAVPHDSEAGIINVLRPLHAVEIELRGGIRVERIKWLRGHPPQVRLRGDDDDLDVTIDQQTAACDDDGNYTVPMWDDPGVHRVFCGGAIASYELIAPPLMWESFPAFTYERTAPPAWTMTICGPIVKGVRQDTALLPSNGPTLVLGAVPGQIALATPPFDVRGRAFLAAADFPIVWAVPSTPLQANRETSSIQLVHPHLSEPIRAAQKSGNMVRRWADAIMDASYKRLRIEPKTDGARRLWAEYKRIARRIKKESR